VVQVAVRNESGRTWIRGQDNLHHVDSAGNDVTYSYCGSDPRWVNGNAVFMDEQSVPSGQVAHFGVHVCGQPGYTGSAILGLQYVREGVAHYDPKFGLFLNFYAPGGVPSGGDPGSSAGRYESNDTRADAYGPLKSNTAYTAQIETENDEDWFRFYTDRPTQLSITLSNVTNVDECFGPEFNLEDKDGVVDSETSSENEQSGGLTYSTPGAGAYYIDVSQTFGSCTPRSIYTLVIRSSSPLTGPGAVQRCLRAKDKVKLLKHKLRRAHSPDRRISIRRKLRKAKAEVRDAC
jgi:hypothetical protein